MCLLDYATISQIPPGWTCLCVLQTSNCELTKLQDENNALKQRLRDVEDRYDSLRREAKSIQDENKSLMTALKLLNNEINGKESKYRDGRYENIKEQNLHDEETPWVTVRDNKTMLRNKKKERQLPAGRKMPARNSTDIASQTINNEPFKSSLVTP